MQQVKSKFEIYLEKYLKVLPTWVRLHDNILYPNLVLKITVFPTIKGKLIIVVMIEGA